MSEPTPRPASGVLTALIVTLWAVCCLTPFAVLVGVVPQYRQSFDDFRLRLPVGAEVTLHVSRWFVNYWYVAMLSGAIIFLPAVAALTWLIARRARRAWVIAAWCALLMIVPLGAAFLAWLSCHLPFVDLMEGLTK